MPKKETFYRVYLPNRQGPLNFPTSMYIEEIRGALVGIGHTGLEDAEVRVRKNTIRFIYSEKTACEHRLYDCIDHAIDTLQQICRRYPKIRKIRAIAPELNAIRVAVHNWGDLRLR